ncbi:hypothetical protein GGI35DRAFT_9053 [Trichoderma velutinum]
MSTMARSLALLAFSSAAAMAAQSTTVSLLLPYVGNKGVVGSVIGADSTATTYAFACAPGQAAKDCDFEATGSQTVTQGPTTWVYSSLFTTDEGIVTEAVQCKLSSAVDVASCNSFIVARITATTVISTPSSFTSGVYSSTKASTLPFLDFQSPVTITAGLDKLKAAPGSTATDDSTAAPTDTGASKTSQTTASSSAASTTLASQTTAASTASTTAAPSSTNAAGLVNSQNGLLAGVAAVVGGVMML